ncbi:ParB/RepB/Spo0J family partition protein [Vibrio sp. Hal054]|uniref:ParB/RepB/Spo0J family partition protein n=1 Tax=Vibrio sp. Hal054 TaxID=3035158 RepID=UPI00301CFFCC
MTNSTTSISNTTLFKAIKSTSGYKRADSHQVHIDSINYDESKNIRSIDPEQVEALTVAFRNGQKPKDLLVFPVEENGNISLDIIGGHHTYLAVRDLVDNENYDPMLSIKLFRGTQGEKLVAAYNDNQQVQMTPLENARAFKTMLEINEGWTNSDIMKATGKTLSFISDALFLLNGDAELIQMIEDKKISPSAARKLLRAHGAENATAVAKINLGLIELPSQEPKEIVEIQGELILSDEGVNNEPSNSSVTDELPNNADVKIITTHSTEAKQLQKAAKKATSLRSLTAKQTDEMTELMVAMGNRVEGNTITLNPILMEQFTSMVNTINEIKNHNHALIQAVNAAKSR